MKNIEIYDNGGRSFDRITIIFLNTKTKPLFGGRFYDYEAIGSSATGAGFFQHTNAQRGRHLGKKIKFSQLTSELKTILKNYYHEKNN